MDEKGLCDVCGWYDEAYDEDSVAEHVASTKHKCNRILKEFKKNRKQFRGNREGAVVVCSVKSSFEEFKNISAHKISLSALPNEAVNFFFKLENETRKETMEVLGVHLAHPQPQFTMNDHGIQFDKDSYKLGPKSKVTKDVIVTFKNTEIGHFEMPVFITFRNTRSGKNIVIVRELVIFVEEKKAERDANYKSPYTKEKMASKVIIGPTYEANRNEFYHVPKNLKQIFGNNMKVKDDTTPEQRSVTIETKSIFDTGVTAENYVRFFHHLLWYEETMAKINLKKYNMAKVPLERTDRQRFKLLVPGLAEKRPSLMKGDDLFLRLHKDEDFQYGGRICDITENYIIIDGIDERLVRRWTDEARFDVRFVLSRVTYERMHCALQMLGKHKIRVFPQLNVKPPKPIVIKEFFNQYVANNPEQRSAVEHIVAGTSGTAPYMVYGPPGTGKTITIVEAILQLVKANEKNRILVCTDSNMAADHVTLTILKHRQQIPEPNLLFRANSRFRVWEVMPPELRDCSNGFSYDSFYSVKNTTLAPYKIVVTTLMHAAKYSSAGAKKFGQLNMTHLFIDEAAQASEPACLVPISALLQVNGHLILAGDPQQLGPVCVSKGAAGCGLGISLMERLKKTYTSLYRTESDQNPNYITMLKNNFRSHPDILQIPNRLFYCNMLRPCANPDALSDIDILEGGVKLGRAIVFHGVNSHEQKEGKSPSFFNWKEIDMLKKYVKALIDGHKVLPEDIGVVTPYIRQMFKIRSWLKEQRYSDIEVGTVEAFQGKEKRVIIITTVRANCKLLDYDAKYQLGFLVDDKRFNVALTRAKAKAIVIGNPACLCRDEKWRLYINTCKDYRTYYGQESEQLPRTADLLHGIAVTRFQRFKITEELDNLRKEEGKKENNKRN